MSVLRTYIIGDRGSGRTTNVVNAALKSIDKVGVQVLICGAYDKEVSLEVLRPKHKKHTHSRTKATEIENTETNSSIHFRKISDQHSIPKGIRYNAIFVDNANYLDVSFITLENLLMPEGRITYVLDS